MISKENAYEICKKAISYAEADGCDVIFSSSDNALSRFANNQIHQNLQQIESSIELRLIKDGRVGKASTNLTDDESLKKLAHTASEAALQSKKETDLQPLLGPQTYEEIDAYDEETATISPAFRSETIGTAFKKAERNGFEAAGIFNNRSDVTAIANSEDLFAYHKSAKATFSITISGGDVSGWAETMEQKSANLEVDRVIDEAMEGCKKAANPVDIEPGKYTIILPPDAASDFLFFLAFDVFNGLAFNEGRSAFAQKLGTKMFGDNISIHDDAYHALSKGLPFDFEGMPRQKVTFVENGMAKAIAHDRATGKVAGMPSTGHALPQPNPYGPIPLNLVIDPGDGDLESMIEQTERGLYVTHFHYTNVIDPQKQIITGMTRDGVFLIEDGKITRPVCNLRFTESAFTAFSNVVAITKNQKNVSGGFGDGFVVPGMKIENFAFTSKTNF